MKVRLTKKYTKRLKTIMKSEFNANNEIAAIG
jgi:hypothetical protein